MFVCVCFYQRLNKRHYYINKFMKKFWTTSLEIYFYEVMLFYFCLALGTPLFSVEQHKWKTACCLLLFLCFPTSFVFVFQIPWVNSPVQEISLPAWPLDWRWSRSIYLFLVLLCPCIKNSSVSQNKGTQNSVFTELSCLGIWKCVNSMEISPVITVF